LLNKQLQAPTLISINKVRFVSYCSTAMLCAVFNYILLRILQSALPSRSRKVSDVVVSRGEVTALGGGQPTLKPNTSI